jgi:hypothetical protein
LSSIRLHEKLGVNPRLTYYVCPCCGQEKTGQDLLLMGSRNHVSTCNACGMRHIGGTTKNKCQNPDCKSIGNFTRRQLRDSEKIQVPSQICGECKELMHQGVVFISVRDGEEGKDNPYRTGSMCVLREEAVRDRLPIQPDELKEQIISKRMCFVPDAAWDMLGFPREDIDNRGKDSDDQS